MTDPVDGFLARLQGARSTGPDKWSASCPAHPDDHPSLSVSRGEDGRVLARCHAGCSFNDILSAIGWQPHDAFVHDDGAAAPTKRLVSARSRPSSNGRVFGSRQAVIEHLTRSLRGRLNGEWIYRDAAGADIFHVVRFDECRHDNPKQYRPIYEGEDGWRIGDPLGLLPLYGLPVLIAAATVWVCEGEKCAEILRSLGLVATTSAHGAKSAAKSDWSVLAGKIVILCPDHDDPGDRFIEEVATHLSRVTPQPTVRIVRLPLGNQGDDIEQFVQARKSTGASDEQIRLELEDLADAAGLQVPSPELETVRLSDVTPTTQPFLWPGRIPDMACSLLGGRQGDTKNLFAYAVIACITTGAPWPDDPGGARRSPRSVILLEAEEHLESSIVPRLRAAGADLSRVHSVLGTPTNTPDRTRFISIQHDLEKIERHARQLGDVAMLVVSPITSYLGSVEQNRNEQVRNEIIHPLKRLAETLACAVLILKHPNKDWKNNDPLERISGTTAWTEAMRCVVFIGVDPDEPDDEKNPRRCAHWIKFSIGPRPLPLSWKIRLADLGVPALRFLTDPVTFSAMEMLAGRRKSEDRKNKREIAAEWIVATLVGGPQTAAALGDLALDAVKQNRHFSMDAFDRARVDLRSAGRLMFERKPGVTQAEWWYWLADQPAPEWFVIRPADHACSAKARDA